MPSFDNLTIKILPVFSAIVATLLKFKSVGFEIILLKVWEKVWDNC